MGHYDDMYEESNREKNLRAHRWHKARTYLHAQDAAKFTVGELKVALSKPKSMFGTVMGVEVKAVAMNAVTVTLGEEGERIFQKVKAKGGR